MARVRRYTRTVVARPKKRWASHLFNFDSTGNAFTRVDLCANSESTSTPVSTIIKVGNIKVNLGIRVTMTQDRRLGYNVIICIMYLPEGVAITTYDSANDYMMKHPEWIMAVKFRSNMPQEEDVALSQMNIDVSSRLKRNLNSGDKIVMFVMCPDTNNVSSIGLHGIVRFWTRAN